MKLSNLLFAFALLFLVSLQVSAQISTTNHNFSAAAWNTGGQICKPCHTPHNAIAGSSPLWNHQLSVVGAYTLYSNATFDGVGTIGQPDATSKQCLSCHDGTVALENFSGVTTGTTFISTVGTPAGYANVGTDLSNDHPISFTYNTALATTDGGLYDPDVQASGLGGTITAKMLFSGKMQCASCHNPHGVSGVSKLLRKSNAASALCLTCHNK